MKAAEAAVRSKMGDEPLPAYVYSEMVRLGCEVPYGFDAVRSLLTHTKSLLTHTRSRMASMLSGVPLSLSISLRMRV